MSQELSDLMWYGFLIGLALWVVFGAWQLFSYLRKQRQIKRTNSTKSNNSVPIFDISDTKEVQISGSDFTGYDQLVRMNNVGKAITRENTMRKGNDEKE